MDEQLVLDLTPEPAAPTVWDLLKAGLRETNEPLGERIEFLREQINKINKQEIRCE